MSDAELPLRYVRRRMAPEGTMRRPLAAAFLMLAFGVSAQAQTPPPGRWTGSTKGEEDPMKDITVVTTEAGNMPAVNRSVVSDPMTPTTDGGQA